MSQENPIALLPRRLHDLRSAYLNFKTMTQWVKTGQQLDQTEWMRVLPQLEKSLGTIMNEISFLESDLEKDRSYDSLVH